MIILALDIATKTGWALFDTNRHESAIRVGTIVAQGDSHEAKALDLGKKVIRLLKEHNPDLVAVEQPIRNVKSYSKTGQDLGGEFDEKTINASTALLLNQLTGSVMGVVGGFRKNWMTVTEGTWRKHFIGFGRKPGWTRKDWKKAARDRCSMLGVEVKNDDQAEAVGVAHYAAGSQVAKMMVSQST